MTGWISYNDAAHHANVKPATIRRWITEGHITGGNGQVHALGLELWLNRRKNQIEQKRKTRLLTRYAL